MVRDHLPELIFITDCPREANVTKPEVSVVIPTYNQKPDWLACAVESALDQDAAVDVIIVDDGSTDPVVFDNRVRVIRHQRNRGISAALNTGIAAASTPWICWLSSDDLMHQGKVRTQLDAMIENGALASFHAYYIVKPSGAMCGLVGFPPRLPAGRTGRWPSLADQIQVLTQGCVINGSTTMIHRSVFDELGGYDESYRFAQDYEMWCRIGRVYQWLFIYEPMGSRREGENLTARIQADPRLRAVMQAEDDRIRAACLVQPT